MPMNLRWSAISYAALVWVLLTFVPTAYASEYKRITWDDLMPPGWIPEPPPEFSLDIPGAQEQGEEASWESGFVEAPPSPLVKELDKQNLEIPGYVLPLVYTENSVLEFLLVPYIGACIHVPPPPDNQILYVKLKKPYQASQLYAPVWVKGTMKVARTETEYGRAGYQLEAAIARKYQ